MDQAFAEDWFWENGSILQITSLTTKMTPGKTTALRLRHALSCDSKSVLPSSLPQPLRGNGVWGATGGDCGRGYDVTAWEMLYIPNV